MKIVQATGQTCNQFWIYSNFLADAIENNELDEFDELEDAKNLQDADSLKVVPENDVKPSTTE